MKSKKEHNNKTAYMHMYTYMNSTANSAQLLVLYMQILIALHQTM